MTGAVHPHNQAETTSVPSLHPGQRVFQDHGPLWWCPQPARGLEIDRRVRLARQSELSSNDTVHAGVEEFGESGPVQNRAAVTAFFVRRPPRPPARPPPPPGAGT